MRARLSFKSQRFQQRIEVDWPPRKNASPLFFQMQFVLFDGWFTMYWAATIGHWSNISICFLMNYSSLQQKTMEFFERRFDFQVEDSSTLNRLMKCLHILWTLVNILYSKQTTWEQRIFECLRNFPWRSENSSDLVWTFFSKVDNNKKTWDRGNISVTALIFTLC